MTQGQGGRLTYHLLHRECGRTKVRAALTGDVGELRDPVDGQEHDQLAWLSRSSQTSMWT